MENTSLSDEEVLQQFLWVRYCYLGMRIADFRVASSLHIKARYGADNYSWLGFANEDLKWVQFTSECSFIFILRIGTKIRLEKEAEENSELHQYP